MPPAKEVAVPERGKGMKMDQRFFTKFETEVLGARKLDGVLITSPANMRKYSGFRGEGIVYCSKELNLVFTDSRYTEAAREECPAFEIIRFQKNLYECWVSELVSRLGAERASQLSVGFEDECMTVQTDRTIRTLFEKYGLDQLKWTPLHKSLDRLRQVKDDDEIRMIERAEQIGDEAFARIMEKLVEMKKGGSLPTEKQVAAWLEFYMKELGAENTSFDTIAASGIHSSMPHAIPTDRVLADGDFLTMDFGCRVNGYCSDMTRTIAVGRVSGKQQDVYDTVLRAQQAAFAVIRPGVKGCEVDAAARSVIADAGYGDCFGHGLGHSVGLMIHETPCFSPRDEAVFEPGMVVTVEPGIYLEGMFGVRIEDLIVITEDGYRNLTHSPKELLVI